MALDIKIIQDRIKDSSFFISKREIIEYLIGSNLDPLEEYALFITCDKAVIFTPHDIESTELTTILYNGYSASNYQDKLQNIITELKNIIIPQHIQMCYEYEPIIYLKVFTDMNRRVTDFSYLFKSLIITKTKEQLERIKKCVEINEKTYESILKNFKHGMNELDAYKLVKESNYHNSGDNIPFVCDIVAGKRTCDVSGFPTEYIPQTGDTMILDLLPRTKGVYCDHTRTFFIGKATEKQRNIYSLILEAIKRVEKILKPGTHSKDIYESIYETFKEESLHKCFPHHGGHGIGLTIYEPPYFIKEDDKTLQHGMIVAIEPGIYIKEEFGIRIENNYFITEDGFELLGNIPTEIDEYIIKI